VEVGLATPVAGPLWTERVRLRPAGGLAAFGTGRKFATFLGKYSDSVFVEIFYRTGAPNIGN